MLPQQSREPATLGGPWLPPYSGGIDQTLNEGAVTTMTADAPTIVFVHGAWADATGFDGSIRALRDRGFAVIGAANPLRHLTGDTDSLVALLGTISGPIVLVGHSYGGAVMSNAATGNEQVQDEPFRRRVKDSWPSVGTRGSRRWPLRTRPWFRSRRS
jgi:pimeloyl-ACP methyl ester carboxylesterase